MRGEGLEFAFADAGLVGIVHWLGNERVVNGGLVEGVKNPRRRMENLRVPNSIDKIEFVGFALHVAYSLTHSGGLLHKGGIIPIGFPKPLTEGFIAGIGRGGFRLEALEGFKHARREEVCGEAGLLRWR